MSLLEDPTFLQMANARRKAEMNTYSGVGVESAPLVTDPKQRLAGIPTYLPVGGIDAPGEGGKYAPYYQSGMDFTEMVAEGQGPIRRLASAVPRLLGSVLTKTITQAGYAGGLIGLGNEGQMGTNWIAEAADNAVANFGRDAEEKLKEMFPIYKSRRYTEGNIFQQLGTSQYWTDDFVDGFAFMISAFAPGLILGKLGAGAATASKIADASRIMGTGTINAAKLASNIDWLTTTALSTAAESMFEAKDARDTTYNNLVKTIDPDTGFVYTPDKAKQIAADNAANVFQSNMAVLSLSNALEAKWLMKGLGLYQGQKTFNKSLNVGLKELTEKPLTGLSKTFDNTILRHLGYMGKGSLTEGLWEENIQQSIQDMNHLNRTQYERNAFQGFEDLPEEAMLNFTDLGNPERQKAIMGGVILGALGSGYAGHTSYNQKKAAIKKTIEEGNKANTAFLDPNIYAVVPGKTTEYYKQGESYFKRGALGKAESITQEEFAGKAAEQGYGVKDESGKEKPIPERFIEKTADVKDSRTYDPDKIKSIFEKVDYSESIQNVIDLHNDKTRDNKYVDEVVKNNLFTDWLTSYLNMDNYELAMKQLDKWETATTEELSSLGYVPEGTDFDIKKTIAEYRKKAEKIKGIHESIVGTLVRPRSISEEDWGKYHNYRLKLASNIMALESSAKIAEDELAKIYASSSAHDASKAAVDKIVDEYEALNAKIQNIVEKDLPISPKDFEKLLAESRQKQEEIITAKKELNEKLEVPIPEDLSKTNLVGNIHELQARQQEFIKRQLDISLKDLQQEWKEVSEQTVGIKKYLAKRESIFDSSYAPQITKDTKAETLNDVLQSMFKRRVIRQEMMNQKSKILGDYINDRLNQGESALSVAMDVEEAMKRKYRVSKKGMDQLETELQKYVDAFKAIQTRTDPDTGREIIATPEIAVTYFGEDDAGNREFFGYADFETEEELYAWINRYKNAKELADAAAEKLKSFEANKDLLVNRNESLNENEIKRTLLEEKYMNLVAKHIQDIRSGEDIILSPDAIEQDLITIKKLLELESDLGISGRRISELSTVMPGYNNPVTLKEELKNYMDELTKTKLVNAERTRTAELLQEEAMSHFVKSASNVLGLEDPNSPIMKIVMGSKFEKPLKKLLADGKDMLSIDAVIEVLRVTGKSADSLKVLSDKRAELSVMYADLFKKIFPKASVTNDMLTKTNQRSMFNNFVYNLKVYEKQRQLAKDTSVENDVFFTKFMKYKDYALTIKELKKTPGEYSDNAIKLLNTVAELAAIEDVAFNIRNKVELKDKYSAIAEIRDAMPKDRNLLALSQEQEIGLHQAYNYVNSSPSTDQSSKVYMQPGFTGTGKTQVFVRWLTRMMVSRGWKREDILVTSSLNTASQIIANVYEQKDAFTTDKLRDRLKKSQAKLVIVDEINAMNNAEFEAFMNLTREFDGVKFILLGDPNQTSGTTEKSMLSESIMDEYGRYGKVSNTREMGHVRRGRQLISIYRSFIGAVNTFGDRFIASKKDHTTETIKVESNFADPFRSDDMYGIGNSTGVFIDEVKKILDKKTLGKTVVDGKTIVSYKDNRTRMVVTTKDKIDAYRSALKDYNIPVVTITEASGVTVGEVYIDIDKSSNRFMENYNKDIYTAVGRAQYYVFIKGFNLDVVENKDIVNDVKARDEAEKLNIDRLTNTIRRANDFMQEAYGIKISTNLNVSPKPTQPNAPVEPSTEEEMDKADLEFEDEVTALSEKEGAPQDGVEVPEKEEEDNSDDALNAKMLIYQNGDGIVPHKLSYPSWDRGEEKLPIGAKVYYVKEEAETIVDGKVKWSGIRIGVYSDFGGNQPYSTAEGNKNYKYIGTFTRNDVEKAPPGYEKEFDGMLGIIENNKSSMYISRPVVAMGEKSKQISNDEVYEMPDLDSSESVLVTGELTVMTGKYFDYRHKVDGKDASKPVNAKWFAEEMARAHGVKIKEGSIVSTIIINSDRIKKELQIAPTYDLNGKKTRYSGEDAFGNVIKNYAMLREPKYKGHPLMFVSFEDINGRTWSNFEMLTPRKYKNTDIDMRKVLMWTNGVVNFEKAINKAFGVEDRILLGENDAVQQILYNIKRIRDIAARNPGMSMVQAEEQQYKYMVEALKEEAGIDTTIADLKKILETPVTGKDLLVRWRWNEAQGKEEEYYPPTLADMAFDIITDITYIDPENKKGKYKPEIGTVQRSFINIGLANFFAEDLMFRVQMSHDGKEYTKTRMLSSKRSKIDKKDMFSVQTNVTMYNKIAKYLTRLGYDVKQYDKAIEKAVYERSFGITTAKLLKVFTAYDQDGNSNVNGGMGIRFNIQQKSAYERLDPNDFVSTLQSIEDEKTWIKLDEKGTQEKQETQQPPTQEFPKELPPPPSDMIPTPVVTDYGDRTPSNYTGHSGGALGSDSYWDLTGAEYGVKFNHYWHGEKTPAGNTELTQEQLEEGWQMVLRANKTLKRKPEKYKSLLSRNWFQVKNADTVYAIGRINPQKSTIEVQGGTGWAVQMALDAGKPVYLFDQQSNKWVSFTSNDYDSMEILGEAPVLTKNFAGIGTREITPAGRNAIDDVFKNTFDVKRGQTTQTKEVPKVELFDANKDLGKQIYVLNEQDRMYENVRKTEVTISGKEFNIEDLRELANVLRTPLTRENASMIKDDALERIIENYPELENLSGERIPSELNNYLNNDAGLSLLNSFIGAFHDDKLYDPPDELSYLEALAGIIDFAIQEQRPIEYIDRNQTRLFNDESVVAIPPGSYMQEVPIETSITPPLPTTEKIIKQQDPTSGIKTISKEKSLKESINMMGNYFDSFNTSFAGDYVINTDGFMAYMASEMEMARLLDVMFGLADAYRLGNIDNEFIRKNMEVILVVFNENITTKNPSQWYSLSVDNKYINYLNKRLMTMAMSEKQVESFIGIMDQIEQENETIKETSRKISCGL